MSLAELRRHALAPDVLQSLESSALSQPLLGPSPLAGSFRGSQGLALIFTRAGLDELQRRFGFLAPFLELALGESCNAFYVNLLVLGPGARVGRHTDATLRGPSGDAEALPRRVSVLYLCASAGQGGELSLFDGDRALACIEPAPGLLVHFDGHLAHEVSPLLGDDAQRVSLVCEQYALSAEALERMPELEVRSRAGFAAFLATWRAEPRRALELER